MKKNLSELPSHFIVDAEVVVVKNQQIKPFHDVTLLLGKKEKPVEQECVIIEISNKLVRMFAYVFLIFFRSIRRLV